MGECVLHLFRRKMFKSFLIIIYYLTFELFETNPYHIIHIHFYFHIDFFIHIHVMHVLDKYLRLTSKVCSPISPV